ncbi:MAG TPA: DNA sulfur modification protein DndD [Verrucomicrobiae bacterium]|nr:DNA sulfur modification protein DndD [Verrucomicrobiae bacterium]
MILKNLILENYCLFSGPHKFDLEPRVKYGTIRPIILFGGKNGSGKTTFLSAILLAFYGRQSLGERITEKEYHLILRNRIHRNQENGRRASFSKIGLSFELVTQGEKQEYYIERSWTSGENSAFEEFFKVERGGKALEDVSRDHLQSFIADIVPERLSQLFFFDGEKIKNIAEDITSNTAISEAIQTLLGLDMVKILQIDLATFRTKLLKASNPTAYEKEMTSIEVELKRLYAEKARLDTEDKHHKTLIDGITADISRLEKQLAQQGGNFAQARATNLNLASELESKCAIFENKIREECNSTLPFTLCPNICRRLATQLENEMATQKYRAFANEISQLQGYLLKAISKKFSKASASSFAQFLKEIVAAYGESHLKAGATEIHSLSERDAALVVEFIRNQAPASAKRLISTLNELEDAYRKLRIVNKDLEKTPDQLTLKDSFSELNMRHQDLGRTEEMKRKIVEELRTINFAISQKEREKEKIEAGLGAAKNISAKTALIQKLDKALASYMKRLTQAKIAQLQSEVTECYNRLARKSDFVRRIEINSESFSVAVIDKFGRSIPKEDLSSGEKQIFAVSMLWGLARTAGRHLPVVIDTPLGRLDSDHRENLIKNYFPHAGHQVILLSTDTEVDKRLFKELSPSISHCYHLKYDEKEARSSAETEYFWREEVAA